MIFPTKTPQACWDKNCTQKYDEVKTCNFHRFCVCNLWTQTVQIHSIYMFSKSQTKNHWTVIKFSFSFHWANLLISDSGYIIRTSLTLGWNSAIESCYHVIILFINQEWSCKWYTTWGYCNISRLEGIRTFWVQKIRQENLSKFIEISNYSNSSCILFCVKIF